MLTGRGVGHPDSDVVEATVSWEEVPARRMARFCSTLAANVALEGLQDQVRFDGSMLVE
jgi:hypothetical protein